VPNRRQYLEIRSKVLGDGFGFGRRLNNHQFATTQKQFSDLHADATYKR
jgi:hypothetical protein